MIIAMLTQLMKAVIIINVIIIIIIIIIRIEGWCNQESLVQLISKLVATELTKSPSHPVTIIIIMVNINIIIRVTHSENQKVLQILVILPPADLL